MNEPLSWEDFIDKMEWEGGIAGLLAWGGAECFPVELQPLAQQAAKALDGLKAAIEAREEAE